MMYIDPNMRAQNQLQNHQAQAKAQAQAQMQAQQAQAMGSVQQHQQHLGARQTTDGLGLLLEAFDTHQGAAAAAGADQPYDPNAVVTQAGYYGQPGAAAMAGNDGYENELQFYIDGPAAPVQGWMTGGPGMYGY